ncbi:hypothetical protein KI387_023733, partial [Taxus chinensis]
MMNKKRKMMKNWRMPSGSRFHFLTIEGVDDQDDYDDVVAKMNNESYAIMTWESDQQK